MFLTRSLPPVSTLPARTHSGSAAPQLNRFRAANEANEREQEGYAAKQQQLEGQIQQVRGDVS
jgi:hypothetical protein